MIKIKAGDVLYHKTKGIRCFVQNVDHENLKVSLDKPIGIKNEVTMPISHIGEYLFYNKEDIQKSLTELSRIQEYEISRKVSEFIQENGKRLKEEAEYKEALKRCIQDRKIYSLIHFTRLENLEGILSHGFLSIDDLSKKELLYMRNDVNRFDHRTDCTCFSIEFPNCYLFSNFRKRYCDSRWVVLELDASLLLEHGGEKYFCQYNAASKNMIGKLRTRELNEVQAFEAMFADKYIVTKGEEDHVFLREHSSNIKPYITSAEQAEILIKGNISSKYIRRVYFNDDNDYNSFLRSNKLQFKSNYKFLVNKNYFKYRESVIFPDRR